MGIRLFLFGAPHIQVNGLTVVLRRRKALALLAFLVMDERIQSRETVAALLWPDLNEESARNSLRATLPLLTHLCDPPWLKTNRNTLAVIREEVWSDVQAFLKLLAQVRMHAHESHNLCSECVAALEQAEHLYIDDFLAGFNLNDSLAFDNWQIARQQWLHQEYVQILRQLAEYYAISQINLALNYARRWLEIDPFNEMAHRLMMRLYLLNNQRSEALRQYLDCVQILDQEFATPPEDETQQLYELIRGGSQTTGDKTTVTERDSVYIIPALPGLMIGREHDVTEIKSRLTTTSASTQPVVTVIEGWPGVGKSTLLAALAHDPDLFVAFPDGILWASLGETPNVQNELLRWSEALQIVSGNKVTESRQLTQQMTAAMRDKQMLLLIDDVWQPEHVAPFRIEGRHCAIVITTRLSAAARALAPTATDIYRLPQLRNDAALSLLLRLAPEVVTRHRETALELVKSLEGLPLAIQVAGRLLHQESQMGWGVDALMQELREGSRLLKEQPPSDVRTVLSDSNATVAALLNRSTRTLDSETVTRFALLSLFVPKPATFDLDAMAALWKTEDARPTVRILVNRGLLEPLSGGRFQMHALLILHAKSLLSVAQTQDG